MKALVLLSLSGAIGICGIAANSLATSANNALSVPSILLEEIEGQIGMVDAEWKSFVLVTDTDKLTFTVNEKTAYTLNGEKSTVQKALVKGNSARVVYKEGVATEVHVTTES